jgi:hypothetical protein
VTPSPKQARAGPRQSSIMPSVMLSVMPSIVLCVGQGY